MIKGFVNFSRDINYRIYATEKWDEQHGKLVAHINLEEHQAELKVFENGTVLIKTPVSSVQYDLKTGAARFGG
jgi:hypothetical protein